MNAVSIMEVALAENKTYSDAFQLKSFSQDMD